MLTLQSSESPDAFDTVRLLNVLTPVPPIIWDWPPLKETVPVPELNVPLLIQLPTIFTEEPFIVNTPLFVNTPPIVRL